MNIERSLYPKLLESLKTFPVVGLVGPRQVGKTSLARQLVAALAQTGKSNQGEPSAVMLDLERPSDLAKLTEPELFLEPLANRLVVLDEVQLRPDLFPVLRALVDARRTPGRFLILGSAAPALIQQSSETLAGRVEFLELAPLNLNEVNLNEVDLDAGSDKLSARAQTLWSLAVFQTVIWHAAMRRPCAGARRLCAATWSVIFRSWAFASARPPCGAFG